MESNTRILSIALRIIQMVHAVTLIGLLASLLHATRFVHYKDDFIAITALAVLSLVLASLLLSRALRRFIHYPIDLLLVPLWLAATVALGLLGHSSHCISNARHNFYNCRYPQSLFALSLLSTLAWLFSALVGILSVLRARQLKKAAATNELPSSVNPPKYGSWYEHPSY